MLPQARGIISTSINSKMSTQKFVISDYFEVNL